MPNFVKYVSILEFFLQWPGRNEKVMGNGVDSIPFGGLLWRESNVGNSRPGLFEPFHDPIAIFFVPCEIELNLAAYR